MPNYTPRLGLGKPKGQENVDVGVLNDNFDKLDEKYSTALKFPTKTARDTAYATKPFDFCYVGTTPYIRREGQWLTQGGGETGPAGPGVPNGGNPGEVLTKKSIVDQDTEWSPITNNPPIVIQAKQPNDPKNPSLWIGDSADKSLKVLGLGSFYDQKTQAAQFVDGTQAGMVGITDSGELQYSPSVTGAYYRFARNIGTKDNPDIFVFPSSSGGLVQRLVKGKLERTPIKTVSALGIIFKAKGKIYWQAAYNSKTIYTCDEDLQGKVTSFTLPVSGNPTDWSVERPFDTSQSYFQSGYLKKWDKFFIFDTSNYSLYMGDNYTTMLDTGLKSYSATYIFIYDIPGTDYIAIHTSDTNVKIYDRDLTEIASVTIGSVRKPLCFGVCKDGATTILLMYYSTSQSGTYLKYSDDGGVTWNNTDISSNHAALNTSGLIKPGFYSEFGNSNVMGFDSYTFVSKDGKSWTASASGTSEFTKFGLIAIGSTGIYKVDNGELKILTATGGSATRLVDYSEDFGYIFFTGQNLYMSKDFDTWTTSTLPTNAIGSALQHGTDKSGAPFLYTYITSGVASTSYSLVISFDGVTWLTRTATGLPYASPASSKSIPYYREIDHAFYIMQCNNSWTGSGGGGNNLTTAGVCRSTDYGFNWTAVVHPSGYATTVYGASNSAGYFNISTVNNLCRGIDEIDDFKILYVILYQGNASAVGSRVCYIDADGTAKILVDSNLAAVTRYPFLNYGIDTGKIIGIGTISNDSYTLVDFNGNSYSTRGSTSDTTSYEYLFDVWKTFGLAGKNINRFKLTTVPYVGNSSDIMYGLSNYFGELNIGHKELQLFDGSWHKVGTA